MLSGLAILGEHLRRYPCAGGVPGSRRVCDPAALAGGTDRRRAEKLSSSAVCDRRARSGRVALPTVAAGAQADARPRALAQPSRRFRTCGRVEVYGFGDWGLVAGLISFRSVFWAIGCPALYMTNCQSGMAAPSYPPQPAQPAAQVDTDEHSIRREASKIVTPTSR